jgi:hypothetical protein
LFDNGGSLRFYHEKELLRAVNNNEIVMPEDFSRMVHYRINQATMEIEQIWQWGKGLGRLHFAEFTSSIQPLDNGNRFGSFNVSPVQGYLQSIKSKSIELTNQDEIVWEAYAITNEAISNFHAYRTSRLPLYTAAANDLQIGVPVKNLIPKELLREFVR